MSQRLVVLAPIEPAFTGNGLAIRTGLFCRSAPPGVDVSTVVVPVAGSVDADRDRWPDVQVVPVDHARARAGVKALLGDATWRERLGAAGQLPTTARAAPPGLADAVVEACRGTSTAGLHVMRSYLAPLGVAVAERLQPAWATLDLDDDDAAVAASLGDPDSAEAYKRLVSVFAPLFDGLSAASATEAQAMSARHQIEVEHIPNAVDVPPPYRTRTRTRPPSRDYVSLLFVGNLTYPPNAQAARELVADILPATQRRLDRTVRVTLVGSHHPELSQLAGPSVELTGYAPDLDAAYAAADVVVVPLRIGGGTRIKLLEAFAHGVPVVASPVAAAGLAVSDGRHLMLARDPDQAAAAVASLVTEPDLAARLTNEAQNLVRTNYSLESVSGTIRAFYGRAAARPGGRLQPASSP